MEVSCIRDVATRQEPNDCSRLVLVYLGVLWVERVETEELKFRREMIVPVAAHQIHIPGIGPVE